MTLPVWSHLILLIFIGRKSGIISQLIKKLECQFVFQVQHGKLEIPWGYRISIFRNIYIVFNIFSFSCRDLLYFMRIKIDHIIIKLIVEHYGRSPLDFDGMIRWRIQQATILRVFPSMNFQREKLMILSSPDMMAHPPFKIKINKLFCIAIPYVIAVIYSLIRQ